MPGHLIRQMHMKTRGHYLVNEPHLSTLERDVDVDGADPLQAVLGLERAAGGVEEDLLGALAGAHGLEDGGDVVGLDEVGLGSADQDLHVGGGCLGNWKRELEL